MTTTTYKPKLRGRKVRKSPADRAFNIFAYCLVIFLTLIVLLPMMNIIAASLSGSDALLAGRVYFWPVEPTLSNYAAMLRYKSVWLGYRNTIFYTVLGTLINVIMTMLCAYPLSQKGFSGRRFFSILFFIPMIFSGGMIPNYMLIRDLNMLNTIWSLIIPGAINITNMIITRTFIQSTIPESLAEAAKLDGCSPARYFFSFVLPLSTTIIAVISMYYAVGHWNAYFNALLYITRRDMYPLQLFLREILVQSSFDSTSINDPDIIKQMKNLQATLKYVTIVVSTLPLMLIYPFTQKYFIKGVMIGSIKG